MSVMLHFSAEIYSLSEFTNILPSTFTNILPSEFTNILPV